MTNNTLLAHVAARFGTGQEDLATEALNYILNSSSVARMAFVRFLSPAGLSSETRLTFRTQASGVDGDRPDLIGTNESGEETLIVESKFWATLTDKQPVAYLKRLGENGGKILLFLVPAKRIELIWDQLMQRVQSAELQIVMDERSTQKFPVARVEGNLVLAACTLNSALAQLMKAVEDAGEGRIVSDIRQLQGLCSKLEQATFEPIRSEEISPEIAKRITQYDSLMGDVIQQLVITQLVTDVGRKVAGTAWYGYHITFAGLEKARLAFTVWLWSRHAATPLWLTLPAPAARYLTHVKDRRPLEVVLEGQGAHVPLYLPVGVEREQVVQALVDQMERLAALLQDRQKVDVLTNDLTE